MEFGIEECTKLMMRSRKRHMAEGIELQNQEKIKTSKKRKITSIWGYRTRTHLNKRM